MPTIEKNTTVQFLDPGDEITWDGARGSVQDVIAESFRLVIANDEGMHTVDLSSRDYVTYEDGNRISPVWVDEGDEITGPVSGTVVERKRVNIVATIASMDGVSTHTFTGDEEIIIHNWPETGLMDCDVCARGEHHGPKQARCPCCSTPMEMWDVDFIGEDDDYEDWGELTDCG